MAKSLNEISLIGNLGNAPEIRATNGGKKVGAVSLATSTQWTDKDGQKQERTQWHRLVFWDKMAEVVGQYARKGSRMYVKGEMEYRQFTKSDGSPGNTAEVRVREFIFLDSAPAGQGQAMPPKTRGAAGPGDGYDGYYAPPLEGDDDLPF